MLGRYMIVEYSTYLAALFFSFEFFKGISSGYSYGWWFCSKMSSGSMPVYHHKIQFLHALILMNHVI